ncbi:WDR19 [Symbiodinium sp. CCMP2592]|nr:WDR19 [Symbiodinium sp. CCMP2592]
MRTEKAPHPSLVGYTSAISRQQWQKALELLSELRGFALEANVITFTAVIGTCARAGQWQQAAGMFRILQAESLQPTLVTYNSGISACDRAVQWRSAIDYLSAAKMTKPDKVTYSSAMSSCGRCQRWREGFALFREARVHVEMDVVVYGSAMAVIASIAEWRRSLVLLRQMPERSVTLSPTLGAGLRPDLITCNAFLAACGNASLWERTDIISHNCAIKACDTREQWQRALVLLAELPNALEGRKLSDAVTDSVAISASQKQTRWQSGLLIWDIEHGRQAAITTSNSALVGCADAARWQEAVCFTCGLDSKRPQPDVVSYNTSLSACAKSFYWQYPLLLVSILVTLRPRPTTISYNSAISACEGLGEWMQAVHLLTTAEGYRLQPSVITFGTAISACAAGKKWQEAVVLLAKCAEQMPPDVVAYNACLNACEKAGQWSAALALLSELCNHRDIAGSVPDVVSYNSTISVCALAAKWELALSLLCRMGVQRLQPNMITYNSAFAAMAAASAVSEMSAGPRSGSRGKWQHVLELLRDIGIRRLHANVLTYNSAISVLEACDQHMITASLLGQVRSAMAGESDLKCDFACQYVLSPVCGYRHAVVQLEWDKDGEILAILQQKEETVMLWRHSENKLDMVEMNSKDPTWLSWSKTGPQLVIGTARGNLIIYNKRTMKKQTIMGKHSKRISCGGWHSDNIFATGSEDKTICLSNEEGDPLESGGDSEPLRIKNDPSMLQIADVKSDDPKDSERERVVSIVLGEVTLLLCNLKDPQKPTELAFQPKYGTIKAYSWIGDGYLVVGFSQGYIVVISSRLREISEELSSVKYHRNTLDCLCCSKAAGKIASAGDDGIKLISMKDWTEIRGEKIQIRPEAKVTQMHWSDDGELLSFCTETGWVYCFLAKLSALSATCNTRLAYLTSLREMTIIEGTADTENKVVLQTDVEPAFVALGPSHLATGMNNRIWFYSCTDQAAVEKVNEQEYIGSVESVSLNATHACVLIDGRVCPVVGSCFCRLSSACV